MVGNNSASVVADAYIKGLRGYDIETLWEALKHGANAHLRGTASGRLGYESYNQLGYVANNIGIGQNVARTLEYAYNDWAIYTLGKKLGKPESETDIYKKRALNYKNVYHPEHKLMVGKNDKGVFSPKFYKRCDRLIAMSEPLQERLCARTGKTAAEVAIIPQYCEDFYAVPQPDPTLEERFAGRFNLVFTGTFTPAQSLDMVINAVLDARAAGAEALHLLLVGDGMSREALQKQVADLRAEDAVTFYGSVPATDVPKFTALADALLISLSDSPDLGLTVPGKLASYMAAAKPVLASMNGAGYAAVKESGGGLVSPACDRRALVQ